MPVQQLGLFYPTKIRTNNNFAFTLTEKMKDLKNRDIEMYKANELAVFFLIRLIVATSFCCFYYLTISWNLLR